MAIKAVSQLPDPIQPLTDNDLLFLTQYDADNEQYVSVQLSLGDLKDWLNCVPVGLSIAGQDLPAAQYDFMYSVNEAAHTYSNVYEDTVSITTLFSDFFSNASFDDIVLVNSGGGTGHFQCLPGSGFGIYAADGGGDPQTIIFTSLKRNSVEILSDVLGESVGTVHACGQQHFDGV